MSDIAGFVAKRFHDEISAVANNHKWRVCADIPHGVKDIFNHGFTEKGMKDLGNIGLHARAKPRGENDNVYFGFFVFHRVSPAFYQVRDKIILYNNKYQG